MFKSFFAAVLLSSSVQRFGVSRMRDFKKVGGAGFNYAKTTKKGMWKQNIYIKVVCSLGSPNPIGILLGRAAMLLYSQEKKKVGFVFQNVYF